MFSVTGVDRPGGILCSVVMPCFCFKIGRSLSVSISAEKQNHSPTLEYHTFIYELLPQIAPAAHMLQIKKAELFKFSFVKVKRNYRWTLYALKQKYSFVKNMFYVLMQKNESLA